jgi:hypothetical protein
MQRLDVVHALAAQKQMRYLQALQSGRAGLGNDALLHDSH